MCYSLEQNNMPEDPSNQTDIVPHVAKSSAVNPFQAVKPAETSAVPQRAPEKGQASIASGLPVAQPSLPPASETPQQQPATPYQPAPEPLSPVSIYPGPDPRQQKALPPIFQKPSVGPPAPPAPPFTPAPLTPPTPPNHFQKPSSSGPNLPLIFAAFFAGIIIAVASVALFMPSQQVEKTTVIRETPVDSDGGQSAQSIYRKNAKSIVFIVSKTTSTAGSTGSGFVVSDKGEIVTNAHVVSGVDKVSVSFENDTVLDAKVVARDPSTDLALLQVEKTDMKFHTMTLGDSDNVAVGDTVLALGNPFGLERTLTRGIVSAVGRSIPSLNDFQISNVIQTDAAVNPGNSGGPLLNDKGEVIGINSQILTGSANSEGNVGIAFAIPINTAKKLLPQLRSGSVKHAYLGVSAASVNAALKDFGLPVGKGAIIQSVQPGSPAEKAGLKGGADNKTIGETTIAVDGDIIVEIDGEPVDDAEDVISAVAAAQPGATLDVVYLREGQRLQAEVKLAERDNKESR